MTDRIIVAEFRDQQGEVKYPFTDNSTLTSRSGLTMSRESIIDAIVYPVGATGPVWIGSIECESREVTFVLAGRGNTRLATGSFDPVAPSAGILLEDSLERPAGLLVVEPSSIAELGTWPLETHEFDSTALEFVPSVVLPMPAEGVDGFLLPDGSFVSGEVWLVGEDGIVLREMEGGVIRVDIVGDPLHLRLLCEPAELFTTPRLLKTINGIAPDADGRFTITVGRNIASDTILRITPTPTGMKVQLAGEQVGGQR